MKEIQFFALGGLNENGKNFYLLKIKKSYFIIDAGLKYPNEIMYGIDCIIADYNHLEKIKDQIQGIFLTSALETYIGAFSYLIQYLKKPVYTSYFIMQVLKKYLKKHKIIYQDLELNILKDDQLVIFSDTKVSFFFITQCLPETLGLAFETEKGFIVYSNEVQLLQQKDKSFFTDFFKLTLIAKKKVLAFFTTSQGAFISGEQEKLQNIHYCLNTHFINLQRNIIIVLLIPDLLKIQLIIDIAIKRNLKIAILGRKSQIIMDVALQKKYLKIPDSNFVNLKKIEDHLNYKNLVIIVVGKQFEPFYRLQRMCKKTDRLVHLTSEDKVLLMSIESAGSARIYSKTLDFLSRNNVSIDILIKDLLTYSYNFSENLKFMLNLLKPKYLIPISGEYRHQYQVKKISNELDYLDKNIFLLENGDIFHYDFKKEPYVKKKAFKKLGEILIDGTPVEDGNDFIMKDREFLAMDGVIMFIANISIKNKKILGKTELVSKGFITSTEVNNIFFVKLKQNFENRIEFFLKQNNLKWLVFKKNLREELVKFIFKEIRKKPIVIPILITIGSNY
ncbi:ribonuclease J [Candidatus Phytoplasma prunorum]|uniref:ribonuclease J n=1 Tax=Candidatus Phytoplasma prunorum TaxID=47565 RepID=UPI002FF2CB96